MIGDGFGVDVTYVNEDIPLGTAGALGLMPAPANPILVINGDILTTVDFRAMFRYHEEHAAHITVAVRRLEFPVAYSVVQCDGVKVRGVEEKPTIALFVNARMSCAFSGHSPPDSHRRTVRHD